MNDLSLQAAVVVNSEQAETAFDRVGDKAQQMANEVSTSATKAGQAVDKIGDGAGASAEKFTRAESRISASIKRATTELELLGKTASQRLEFNIADKGLDASKFEPALKKLREIEAQAMQAQRAATGSLDKMGVSAAQTAAALRGVPAQFTDIVTSLQGGQAPLTVFLQQGGQLRDMFGGAGTAARALGGYVLGLVNPFTIAAAAVAGIAVAYNQGAKEADAYRAALVTTGNAAGTNAAQLKSYAQEISSVVGTQGKAAEALSALAATGKVGAENLREAAQAAVAYERATGQAASKTAEQFAALRNEPLSAVLKLNDGMNFLTESTYRQIKSLEEQGKTAEAANVAQRAFADTLSGRAGEMERNLGTVERGWIAVKDAAKSAWDAILNVGRASTSVDQLAEVRKQIAQRENQIANGGFGTNEGGAAFGRPSQAATERLRAELAGLQAKAAALEGVAFASKTAAEAERQRGEQVKATAAFDKAGERFLTDKVKMERELAAARVQGAEAGKSQAEIEKRLGEIRASYAKKGGGGVAAENKELRDQQRIFAELAGVSSTYYTELANYQKQRAAGVVTEAQYTAAVEKLIQKQPFAVALAKEEAEAAKVLTKAHQEASAERMKIAQSMEKSADAFMAQNQAMREEIELIGLSTEQQTVVLQQRNDVIILTKEATLAELERQSAISGTQTRVEIALAAEIDALKERNELLGAKGVKNAAVDAAKTAADEWKKTADSINNTLTDALMRGFESGKDFAKNLRDTVVNMFKTMVLRPVINAIINPIAGAAAGALGMSGAQAATGGSGGGLMGLANNASTAYSLISGGMASSMGSLAINIGNMIGSSAVTSFGAGMAGASLAPGLMGPTTVGATGAMGAGASVGQALGAVPGWGWAAAGVLALLGGTGAFSRELEQTNLQGTFGGATGFEGRREDYYRGGLFRSSKSVYTPLDEETRSSLAGQFDAMRQGTEAMAQVLGLGTDAISSFAATVNIKLKGLSAEDAQKKIQAEFDKIAESLAGQALGTDEYTRAGETAVQAITRLSSSLRTVNATFDTLGNTLYEASLSGADMASQLADLFGGLENFGQATATYFQSFYSSDEQRAAQQRALQSALDKVDLKLPDIDAADARAQYRALAEAQDLTTESGRNAYASLLQLSGAFAGLTGSVEEAVKEFEAGAAQIAGVFSQLYSQIAGERGNVASARDKILAPALMGYDQIAAGIAQAMINAPSTAIVQSAASTVSATQSNLAAASGRYSSAASNVQYAGGALASSRTQFDAMQAQKSAIEAEIRRLAELQASFWDGGSMSGYSYSKRKTWSNEVAAASEAAVASLAQLTPSLIALSAQVAQQESVYNSASAVLSRYQGELAQAQAQAAAAQQAQIAAQAQYAAGVRQYIIDAGKSVDKLGRLREETVRYYEAQAQAVQSLLGTIGSVREAVQSAQSSILKPEQINGDALSAQVGSALAIAVSSVFAGSASAEQSLGYLAELQNDVMSYYQQQKQAVEGMRASVANLREAVDSVRMASLSGSESAAEMLRRYGQAYSMALATSGSTRAGYVDTMSNTLPQLAEAIQADAVTAEDWRVQVGQLLAQASTAAGLLEGDAAGNNYEARSLAMLSSMDASLAGMSARVAADTGYQTAALGLLNAIDGSLAAINDASASAEKIISDAVYATGASNLQGLRAVIAAIKGESIPAFATGGFHTGGIRLVGENGPELEATGPSRIYSASQTAAMLSGGGNAELIAEVRALRQEVAGLRAEAQATAGHTSKTARLLDRAMPDGDALATRVAA